MTSSLKLEEENFSFSLGMMQSFQFPKQQRQRLRGHTGGQGECLVEFGEGYGLELYSELVEVSRCIWI